jgi:hypothetical protein
MLCADWNEARDDQEPVAMRPANHASEAPSDPPVLRVDVHAHFAHSKAKLCAFVAMACRNIDFTRKLFHIK